MGKAGSKGAPRFCLVGDLHYAPAVTPFLMTMMSFPGAKVLTTSADCQWSSNCSQRSLLNDPDFQAHMAKEPRFGEAVSYLETGVIEPQLAGQQAVRDILEDAYIKIVNGEDVKATLDEAASLATEAFKRKGGE